MYWKPITKLYDLSNSKQTKFQETVTYQNWHLNATIIHNTIQHKQNTQQRKLQQQNFNLSLVHKKVSYSKTTSSTNKRPLTTFSKGTYSKKKRVQFAHGHAEKPKPRKPPKAENIRDGKAEKRKIPRGVSAELRANNFRGTIPLCSHCLGNLGESRRPGKTRPGTTVDAERRFPTDPPRRGGYHPWLFR